MKSMNILIASSLLFSSFSILPTEPVKLVEPAPSNFAAQLEALSKNLEALTTNTTETASSLKAVAATTDASNKSTAALVELLSKQSGTTDANFKTLAELLTKQSGATTEGLALFGSKLEASNKTLVEGFVAALKAQTPTTNSSITPAAIAQKASRVRGGAKTKLFVLTVGTMGAYAFAVVTGPKDFTVFPLSQARFDEFLAAGAETATNTRASVTKFGDKATSSATTSLKKLIASLTGLHDKDATSGASEGKDKGTSEDKDKGTSEDESTEA